MPIPVLPRSLVAALSSFTAALLLTSLAAGRAAAAGGDPFVDADGDGLDDNWELAHFGNITSQDQFGDPDADGMNNLAEYTSGTDPLIYDGPSAPTPASPACGSEIASLQTVLVANNAVDPQGTPLLYEFGLYADPALTIEVAHSIPLVPQGAGATTEWAVGVNVLENERYYWRVRAKDPYTFGPWSAGCSFFVNTVNEQATAPRINSPAFGAQVHTFQPTLVVENSTDPDHDVLRYQFEVYADPALSQFVALSGAGVAEGAGGTTAWQVNNANPMLQEDRFYYWRARAVDPDNLASNWSQVSQFFVTIVNTPPGTPSIVSPENGDITGTLRPSLVILDAGDGDLDPLVYDWDLARDVQFSQIAFSGTNEPPAGGQTTAFVVPADLEENRHYCWRVRADDGTATSAYNVACFLVSAQNDPPSVPLPERPDTMTGTITPIFSWAPSTDPEADAIAYELEVRDASDTAVASVTGISATLTPIAEELVAGASYTWRVRASDRPGASSAWSESLAFTVASAPVDDDGCCSADSGCQASRGADPGALAGTGLGLALLTLARRRRR